MAVPQPVQEEELTPREQLLLDAPARPQLRDRATIERTCATYSDDFEAAWGTVDHDKLRHDMVMAVEGTRDVWLMARWLEGLSWKINHDIYLILAAFWRSLETHRIEREAEWVMQNGIRFPAVPGQKVAFSQRAGGRRTGLVKDVDRMSARGFVEIKRYGGGGNSKIELIAVNAENVMLVQDSEQEN